MDELRGFGFVLKDVTRLYVQRFEERARSLGLTLSQCKVLVYAAANEGVSQARLGELTEIEPMNLVRILDRMEANGWLERRSDPIDRRARKIYMRPKAKPLVDTIWSVSDATRAEAFAGIPREQVRTLFALLKRVSENISGLAPFPAAAGTPQVGTPRGETAPRARRLRTVGKS